MLLTCTQPLAKDSEDRRDKSAGSQCVVINANKVSKVNVHLAAKDRRVKCGAKTTAIKLQALLRRILMHFKTPKILLSLYANAQKLTKAWKAFMWNPQKKSPRMYWLQKHTQTHTDKQQQQWSKSSVLWYFNFQFQLWQEKDLFQSVAWVSPAQTEPRNHRPIYSRQQAQRTAVVGQGNSHLPGWNFLFIYLFILLLLLVSSTSWIHECCSEYCNLQFGFGMTGDTVWWLHWSLVLLILHDHSVV